MIENIILSTDGYKISHWNMYPESEYITSYLEARVGGEFPSTIFFGLQYLLAREFEYQQVFGGDIEDANRFISKYFGRNDVFNLNGWQHILEEHDGRLPLKIRAVPEGTMVPEGNVLLTIENTCPEVPWLVNHMETMLVRLWYPCQVATSSWYQRKVIGDALMRSQGNVDKLPFMLHDFGARGSTSSESASIGGAAHLLSFLGSDTLEAIDLINCFYHNNNADNFEDTVAGFSIPAAEHSTITAWGKDREVDAYRHILNTYQEGLVSVVSDSYDIYNACENLWGKELKEQVISDKRTLVIRPDSGNPEKVVPNCLDILGNAFGYEVNNLGYKVLPPYIRIIQGDGISRRSLPNIIEAILVRGWSMENVVFGSGGGLLQDFGRDPFAMKCSAIKHQGDEHWKEVYKEPTSDPKKNSKKGYLYLSPNFTTTSVPVINDVLRPVFLNGEVLVNDTWSEIRNRVPNYTN